MKRSPHIHPCTNAAERELAQRVCDNVNHHLAESLFLESLCFALGEEGQEEAVIKRQEGLTHVVLFGRFFITWCPVRNPQPATRQRATRNTETRNCQAEPAEALTLARAAFTYRYNERTLRTYQRCGHLPAVLTHGAMRTFIAGLGGYQRRPRGIECDRAAYRQRIRTAGPLRVHARRTAPAPDPVGVVAVRPAPAYRRATPRTGAPHAMLFVPRTGHHAPRAALATHTRPALRWYRRGALAAARGHSAHALPFGHGPPGLLHTCR